MVRNPPANAGDTRDSGLISGLRRSPKGGHGNPLQYSCTDNPMDSGAWWATVHRVAESDMTEATEHTTHTHTHTHVAHTNGNTHYLSFYVWMILFSIMSSRLIHEM